MPGIYQVRGFDLSDITFVRGKTGWIVFDPLVSAEPVRAAWKLFQEHKGEGLPVSAVIYSHTHGDHWGGVRGLIDEKPTCARARSTHRTNRLHVVHDFRECLRRNAMNRRLFYQYGLLLPASPHGYVGQGLGQAVSAGAYRSDRTEPLRLGPNRGVRSRWRAYDFPKQRQTPKRRGR